MNESEVLNKAADLIEKYGWIQGSLGWRHAGFCALGGIYQATSDLGPIPCLVSNALVSGTKAQLRETIGLSDIAEWNDDPLRTKEEVVAKLREAANAG